jgi:hypothetical protein
MKGEISRGEGCGVRKQACAFCEISGNSAVLNSGSMLTLSGGPSIRARFFFLPPCGLFPANPRRLNPDEFLT